MPISSRPGRLRTTLILLIAVNLAGGLALVGVRAGDEGARTTSPPPHEGSRDPVVEDRAHLPLPPPEVLGAGRARADERVDAARRDDEPEPRFSPDDDRVPSPHPVQVDFRDLRHELSHPAYRPVVRLPERVRMAHDGVELYVEVTRPDPAVHGDGPWPVIMEISPYHGTIATRIGDRIFPDPVDGRGRKLGLTGYFAPRGYAVVMVDLRGTGRSQGCLDHLGPNDAKDIKEIVEWAAEQPWSSGRVGITGHSYVGSTPSLAAAMKPKGLVTIVPSAGLASMYDHQFQLGVPYSFQWLGPMFAYEQLAFQRHLPPQTGPGNGDNFGNDPEDTGCGMPNSSLTAGHGQVTGQYQAWHAARDWRDAAADADIPMFIVHGVNDDAARIPAAEWFFGMREPRPTDKVWIGQWDHGSSSGHPNGRKEHWQYALHAWFDKHLKGIDLDTGPSVEAFLNVFDVYTSQTWRAYERRGTLHADAATSALTSAPPAEASTAVLPAAVPLGGRGTVIFRTAPLRDGAVLLGLPRMKLVASVTSSQVIHLVVTLRAVGGGDFRDIGFCTIQPQLREGAATMSPVVPGMRMTLEPQCFTVAHQLHRGEQLELRIGTFSPHHVPYAAVEAAITIYTGPGGTSVDLPFVSRAGVTRDVMWPAHD